MSTVQVIKQLEDRNVPSEIVLMVWSDRMDLVALANVKGEVALHRLTWTKAWTLNPPKDGVTVKGIAWRPDGKIIAIGYSSGEIMLVKVENKNILHTISTNSDISFISWIQDQTTIKKTHDEDSQRKQYMKNIDLSSNFIPEPIPQQFDSTNPDETYKLNLLHGQSDLNLLLVGTQDGAVHIHIFGCFPCATLHVNQQTVESVHFNQNLEKMFVIVKDSNYDVQIMSFDSQIFFTHSNELFALALKYIKLNALLDYLSNIITTIKESWESILLEMDTKLSNYASKVPEGGVTADFLDLLMFGISSDEMKFFLIHDLTKKGLEKFGQTIEMSYTNIQKLVLKYLIRFGQNLTYHLAELRGMARLEHRYKVLGLQESAINDAIVSNGAFLIKSGEMQQIINHSAINYKAFFKWLYTAIVHVLEEQVPNEVPKMTQQDLVYITEFLLNFDKIGSQDKDNTGFIMERLGQYLTDSNLTIPPDMSGNDWTTFFQQNKCLSKHPSVFQHSPSLSLIQQFSQLRTTTDSIFDQPKTSLGKLLLLTRTLPLFRHDSAPLVTSHLNLPNQAIAFCFVRDDVHVVEVTSEGDTRSVQLFYEMHHVIDCKMYSPTVISVLLQERGSCRTCLLCQTPVGVALERGGRVDGTGLVPRVTKSVEGMVGVALSVSGSRKVGILLAESRRKVRVYEMEGEEEEEEDQDMTMSSG